MLGGMVCLLIGVGFISSYVWLCLSVGTIKYNSEQLIRVYNLWAEAHNQNKATDVMKEDKV